MKVLIFGTGGREAALAWKLAQSPLRPQIFAPRGNDGMERYAQCVDTDPDLVKFCRDMSIDLVVIGPEQPLLDGVADRLRAAGIKVFGPSARAAELEGSKFFTRKLCAEYHIPSPQWWFFDEKRAALSHVAKSHKGDFPLVVKADGLAAGKGVVIAENRKQAEQAIEEVFRGKFGKPALLIEEFMEGQEASFFVLSDGHAVKFFGTAQDHKRALDGDRGKNTGGMGAFSPAVILTPKLEREVMARIIEPTLKAMSEKHIPFSGVLYAGLMITDQGVKLVEFNIRFGDPECQILMMRLKSDLLELLLACSEGRLAEQKIVWDDDIAALVVMAAKGYPDAYDKGSEIKGLAQVEKSNQVQIFHAATLSKQGAWFANGGRVLNVAAKGKTLEAACANVYTAIDKIDWQEGFYRTDIGKKFINP